MLFRFAALVLVTGAAACDRAPSTIEYFVGRTGGHPTLSVGHHLLVFEGVEAPGPDVPLLGSGTVMVGGSGSANGQVSIDHLSITHSYDHGVQTLSVGGTSLKILENGTLQLRNRTVPFHGKPQTLRIASDGTVSGAN